MDSVKNLLKPMFVYLILAGVVIGPIGLIAESPIVAAFGNAMFMAGFFTPVFYKRELTQEDAIFGGVWSSAVTYFVQNGDVSGLWLTAAIPLFVATVLVSKWAGTSFTEPA